MQVPLVMTVIGKDRPGLVESVASLVAQQGGNWLESRMCRLGGEFAGILRIHVDSEKENALLQSLNGLQKEGLAVVIHRDRAEPASLPSRLAQLDIIGQDRPGIVRQIASALASQDVNVEDLTTECSSAPMTGETLFRAQARVVIPAACNLTALRQDLEKIAGDLMVELTFQELRPGD
jgi:glycine cleavage system regulatory protein